MPFSATHGAKVAALQLDVTKTADVANAVARATDVALLINNAGIATNFGSPFTDASLIEAGRQEMQVNGFGPLALTRRSRESSTGPVPASSRPSFA